MASAAQQVMLAQKWSEKVDPTNWWMSEKLDGVRAYWSGSKFFSRQGNEFIAPKFFTKDLPREALDGELWCGRGLFQKTLSIIKKTKDPEKYAEDWKYVTYLVFDAPDRSAAGEKYEQRVKWMEENIEPKKETTYAAVVGVCKCTGMPHLQKMLKQVLMKGGEGIMLRQPKSLYEHCRSHTLLKVKFFHDEEAKVTGHENGSGRLQHLMGKIHCILPNGVAFKVGTGFSDAQRRKPPKIGSVISFKYQEMSDHGHPRFPVFLRERGDMTWADVLENAKSKTPFSSMKKKALVPQLKKMHSILFSTIPSRDQESGKKIVTQDDADDLVEAEAENLLTKKDSMPAAAAGTSKKRGASKRMCQWGAACYRKNQDHLDQFDHPTREEDDAAAAANGGNDDEDDDDDGNQKQSKKRARTEKVASPSAPSASPPASSPSVSVSPPASSPSPSASPPATKNGKRACFYGTDCYNKDPDHIKRFSHPQATKPVTVEEFIETTNQSQHDLAEYYKFGGDDEDDEVQEFLAEDKNERKLSIQRFSDKALADEPMDEEDEDDTDAVRVDEEHEVRTIIEVKKKKSYFQSCASDDDEDEPMEDGNDAKTVAMADLPPPKRVKSGAKPVRVSSTAATEVTPKATRTSSRNAPVAAAANGSSSNVSAAASCVFILPELLAKEKLVVEDENGIRCKRCNRDVGEHREKR